MAEEIGVITYFSLARGFLSGKYRSEADLGKSPRGGSVAKYLDARGHTHPRRARRRFVAASATQAEVALAWMIAQPGVTAPIASATTEAQVDSLIRAVSLKLSAADIAELDRASA